MAKPTLAARLANIGGGRARLPYIAHWPMGRRELARVKLDPDRWFESCGMTRAQALEDWKAMSTKPPAESSGYYHSDRDTWYALKEYKKTLKQGS